jgi:SAM-dependent methyltransferase
LEKARGDGGEDDDDDDDDDDPGTSWFSEHQAPEKVLKFLTSRKFPLSPRNTIPSTRQAPRQQRKQQQQRKKQWTEQHGGQQKQQQPSILDLGTGNGSMLALLRKRGGFKGPMVGVDYSPQSVQLARELQRLKLHSAYESASEGDDDDDDEEEEEGESGLDEEEGEPDPDNEEHEDVVAADNVGSAEAIRVSDGIRFEEWDILAPDSEERLTATATTTPGRKDRLDWFPYEQGGFDIVLDKGTFDAVSLAEDVISSSSTATGGTSRGGSSTTSRHENIVAAAEEKPVRIIQRRVCERYPGIATKLVRKGGFLVVTSCNWTEEELIRWFTADGGKDDTDGLYVWDRVEYPRFRFGGKEGQGVCTVCFRRRGGE